MKKVFFLGCNHLQLDYLKAAQKLGFKVIATDRNPEAPGASLADEFHLAGYLDQDSLLQIAQKAGFKSGDFIFTASAHFAYEGAAQLAHSLGLDFPSPQSIDTCLDKRKFYDLLKSLGIPLPSTRIYRPDLELDPRINYYLKSDYGKTPYYNYYINDTLPELPDKDLYHRDCFLLQEEIVGQHYRVNLYGDQMALFETISSDTFQPLTTLGQHHEEIREKLMNLRDSLGLNRWLTKFDVLVDGDGWYVIDLGLDPPMRLRQLCQWQNVPFCEAYVRQYLLAESKALPPWNELFQDVKISGQSDQGFRFDPPTPCQEKQS